MVNSSDDELKVMPKRAIKRGRRPGTTTARDTIRRCAASAFAASGYDGVTVRAIAAAAGVDSALVHHYFGTKQALFEAALALEELAAVAAIRSVSPPLPSASKPPVSAAAASIGERVVREFLATWDAPDARATIGGLLRSASADERTRTRLTDVIARTIVALTIGAIDARRGMPKLRAAIVAAQLFGIAWTRYVLGTEPIASASAQILGRTLGPSIDAALAGVDYGPG